jgi:hypothetical protein
LICHAVHSPSLSLFEFSRVFSTSDSVCWQPAHAGSSLADFSTLKMEAISSSELSVHTRSIRCHIPEDGILLFISWKI